MERNHQKDAEFFSQLKEILNTDEEVTAQTSLAEGWDSVAIIGAMSAADEVYGVMLAGTDLNKCATVQDILNLVDEEE